MNKDKLLDMFEQFVDTVAKLRDPEDGCPWDIKQSHQTLRKYMIEEAYEASEAMDIGSDQELCSELGDVLLQVVLNAQIAKDEKRFDMFDVIHGIKEKMIRRHPHVFGNEEDKLQTPEQVKTQWQIIKNQEKQGKKESGGFFAECEKTKFPASLQAYEIGKVANKIGFDWDNVSQVLEKLKEEVQELEEECFRQSKDKDRIQEELGDLYFSLAQVSRHLSIDPEVAGQSGNNKFLRRFKEVEKIADKQGVDIGSANLSVLEDLWKQAKSKEKM